MEEMFKKHKNINLSVSNDSHQNWTAERDIKTVDNMARTMLMHTVLRCPEDTLFTDIWKMVTYCAVWI